MGASSRACDLRLWCLPLTAAMPVCYQEQGITPYECSRQQSYIKTLPCPPYPEDVCLTGCSSAPSIANVAPLLLVTIIGSSSVQTILSQLHLQPPPQNSCYSYLQIVSGPALHMLGAVSLTTKCCTQPNLLHQRALRLGFADLKVLVKSDYHTSHQYWPLCILNFHCPSFWLAPWLSGFCAKFVDASSSAMVVLSPSFCMHLAAFKFICASLQMV